MINCCMAHTLQALLPSPSTLLHPGLPRVCVSPAPVCSYEVKQCVAALDKPEKLARGQSINLEFVEI